MGDIEAMNIMYERIQELAEQADGVFIHKLMTGAKQYTFLEKDLEKFAELIVREAGEAFWSEACHVSDLAYEEYYRNSKKIKQHFGVIDES